MKKIAVVYWSQTGNTEQMAMAVLEGIRSSGADGTVFTASEFNPDETVTYDAVAFGCPAMGAEELEDTEFEPMFSSCESKLNGKKIALFGSYGWGTGEWMDIWKDHCIRLGADIAATLICNYEPDDEILNKCKALGSTLAE